VAKGNCTFPGCTDPLYCKGWCIKHYARWRKWGDPAIKRKPRDYLAALFARVDRTEGCWLWTRSVDTEGYGQISVEGRPTLVHRLAYQLLVGPIPPGHGLDHDCHNADASCHGGPACLHRRCVRPNHLTPRLIGPNVLGSQHSTAAKHAAKTHCPHGHPYDKANTVINSKGSRECRICRRRPRTRRRSRDSNPGG
jgi:hypothetical protein